MKKLLLLLAIIITATTNSYSGNIIWDNVGNNDYITCYSITPDNHYLALGFNTYNNIVQVVDLTTKDTVLQLNGYNVSCVSISNDGSLLAFKDIITTKLYVWDVKNKTKILSDTIFDLDNMKFTPDNKNIIIHAINFFYIKLNIETNTKTELNIWHSTSSSSLRSNFDISPNGKYLAVYKLESISSADSIQNIFLYDLEVDTVRTLIGHKYPIINLKFSHDGKTLASVANQRDTSKINETVILWDVASASRIGTIYGPYKSPGFLGFSQNDSILYLQSTYFPDYFLNRYNIYTGNLIDSSNTYKYFSTGFLWDDNTWAFIKNEKLLKYNINNKSLSQFYIVNSKSNMHNGLINSIDVSFDNKYVATAGNDYYVKLWDYETGAFIKNFAEHNSEVRCVQFSPDGKYLASCSNYGFGQLIVREVETGNVLFTKTFPSNILFCLGYSPDGSMIAIAGQLDSIYIYNAITGGLIQTLYSSTIYRSRLSIAFSPDGKYLISNTKERYLKIWKTDDWSNVYNKELFTKPSVNSGDFYKIRFSKSGNLILLPSDNGVIRIFNIDSMSVQDTITNVVNDNGAYLLFDACFIDNDNYIFSTALPYLMKISLIDTSNYKIYDDICLLNQSNYQECIKSSNDSKYIFSGTSLGDVIKWNAYPTTSVNDNVNQGIITIYPNPTSNYIKFNYGLDLPQQLCIYDIYGNIIKEIIPNNINEEISVQDINSGVYNVHIIYKDKIKYSKLNIIR